MQDLLFFKPTQPYFLAKIQSLPKAPNISGYIFGGNCFLEGVLAESLNQNYTRIIHDIFSPLFFLTT